LTQVGVGSGQPHDPVQFPKQMDDFFGTWGEMANKRARTEASASGEASARDTVAKVLRFQRPSSPSWRPEDQRRVVLAPRKAPRKATSGDAAANAVTPRKATSGDAAATAVAPRKATSATPTRGVTPENRQKINDALSAFDKHVSCLSGLDEPKEEFREIMTYMLHHQLRRQPHGERVNHNIIIKGRPGTGKTTLVRALYEAMYAAGVLEGNFVEVKPNKLTSGFGEKLQEAMGGMMFIDEAYELETKRTLNNDLNRVIDEQGGLPLFVVAGYPDKIEKWLAHDNPKGNIGLRSRFAYEVTIPDYSADDLMKIFDMKLRSHMISITPESRPLLLKMSRDIAENPQSGNGRDVKQIVERIDRKWAISKGIGDLNLDTLCDAKIVQDGIDAWL